MNLLTKEELLGLRPVMALLRERRSSILSRWYDLYLHHFGSPARMAREAFDSVFGEDLDALVDNLIDVDYEGFEADLEGFEADVTSLGHRLIEAGVTFPEVVASLHLFEASASEHLPPTPEGTLSPGAYQAFDKLSHCRMILLSNAYFTAREAEAKARILRLEEETASLVEPTQRITFHGLVGSSAPMRKLYQEIATASSGQGAVFIAGESGTGKELVARAVHEAGGGPGRPFVPVNCAALPRELIESEFFGHDKGAFTGSRGEYLGIIRSASRGTVFLDEVTEMIPETQAKLLRVLEEKMVRPVGSVKEIAVDVRFVASTNRDPERAVEAGLLRKDLFHRLGVFRLVVPPLRARLEDVPVLASHFLTLFAERGLRLATTIDPDALSMLQRYAWPGNIRELRNAIEHALAAGVGRDTRIRLEDLPAHVVRSAQMGDAPPLDAGAIPTIKEAEGELIRKALAATGGNKQKAARLLRISRHRLYDRLRKLGLET